MPTLSVAMIVNNEQQNLPQCLDTVKDWVDEIVILDSGSTDKTEQIAQEYGAKFYTNTDWQGFGKQRQLAQKYVTSDYVFWIDADERVTEELKQSIIQAVKTDKSDIVYAVGRLNEIFGRKIRHSGWYPDYVLRLYKTDFTQYGNELIHEIVFVPKKAKIIKLKGDLIHYPYKNIYYYLTKSTKYTKAWADQKECEGKKASLFQAITHSLSCFIKMYFFKMGILDGKQGLILAVLSANAVFCKYTDLWTRNIKN